MAVVRRKFQELWSSVQDLNKTELIPLLHRKRGDLGGSTSP